MTGSRIIFGVAVALIIAQTSTASAQTACLEGDVNCDSVITSSDIIVLVNYVFKTGPPPCSAECQSSPPLSARRPDSRSAIAAEPGHWDTITVDSITVCDTTAPLSVGLFVHNHDSLLTLILPLAIRRVCGYGFVRFDSLVWIDRLADPAIVDETFWAIGEVDGVDPDWVYIRVRDRVFTGQPPLDSGAGYLCELYFTPVGGPSQIELKGGSFGADAFMYLAREAVVQALPGYIAVNPIVGSGDLNYDLKVSVVDIILLVREVFGSPGDAAEGGGG